MLISRLVLRQLNVTVRPKTVRRSCAIWRARGAQKVDQITRLMRRSQPPTETPRGFPRGASMHDDDDVVLFEICKVLQLGTSTRRPAAHAAIAASIAHHDGSAG